MNGDRNRERKGAEDGAPLQKEGMKGGRLDSKVGPSSSVPEENSRRWPSLEWQSPQWASPNTGSLWVSLRSLPPQSKRRTPWSKISTAMT